MKQSLIDQKPTIDQNMVFQGLQTGQVFDSQTQNSVEYKQAQERIGNMAMYENMSPKSLSNAMQSGKLLP